MDQIGFFFGCCFHTSISYLFPKNVFKQAVCLALKKSLANNSFFMRSYFRIDTVESTDIHLRMNQALFKTVTKFSLGPKVSTKLSLSIQKKFNTIMEFGKKSFYNCCVLHQLVCLMMIQYETLKTCRLNQFDQSIILTKKNIRSLMIKS